MVLRVDFLYKEMLFNNISNRTLVDSPPTPKRRSPYHDGPRIFHLHFGYDTWRRQVA
jgi:hypothetical protein